MYHTYYIMDKKQNTKMKRKPKFNIGDIVYYKEDGDTIIAKINTIIIDECKDFLYGFDGVDDAQYEDDIRLYEKEDKQVNEVGEVGLPNV